jgi:hypothetical protein
MTESTKAIEFSPEASIPEGGPLESILCTEELRRRPWRPPDYKKEKATDYVSTLASASFCSGGAIVVGARQTKQWGSIRTPE